MSSSWSKKTPRVLLSADTPQFDATAINHWREEGFIVSYLPFSGSKTEYTAALRAIPETLAFGEEFSLIAYGDAAAAALETSVKPINKMNALVGYYPPSYPAAKMGLPPNLKVLLHLSADSLPPPTKYPTFTYDDAHDGFAEPGSSTYDLVSTRVAWTRTLALVRKGFRIEAQLEDIWEDHLAREFAERDVDATMKTMVAEPYVNHIPTMTGGIGYKDLHRFYKDYFIPSNPPSMKMKLLSRTIGTDRVVDELYVSFRHTQEVAWMLPGVQATDRPVELVAVAVVCIRGTKLYHEHIYWDQASVLVQLGLLDPTNLPVVGAEAARKVLDESSEPSNRLIKDW